MTLLRTIAVALLAASTLSAAELRTLKGELHKGELVSLNDKEVVFEAGGKKLTLKIEEVLTLNLSDDYEKLADVKYILVELTDGSQFKCAKIELKKGDAELGLLQGQKVQVPIKQINWILNDAQNAEHQREFKEKVLTKKDVKQDAYDVVLSRNENVYNPIPGTLSDEADETGKKIDFTLRSKQKIELSLDRPVAFFFRRGANPLAKPIKCKVEDTAKNLVYASEIKQEADGYTVVTSAGATVKYPTKLVARLDYSTGKFSYLSALVPSMVKETSTEGRIDRWRRDENLDGGKIKIAGTEYAFGLSMHSTTELEYNLAGAYREFKATVGIDDDVGGDEEPAVLIVYADNKEVLKWQVSRKDKERTRQLNINIKDVDTLRIVVTTSDFLDLGKHVTLAEARVSK